MRLLSKVIVLFLFVLSGCATLKVEDISGIKSMLGMRVKAERLASEVKDKYKSSDQKDILNELKKLYDEVYDENNGWIDGIKFDLQSRDIFKVSQKEYSEHLAGLAAVRFINKAEETLKEEIKEKEKSLLTIEVGVEAGKFVSEIMNNIIEQHNKKVEAARERIYKQLEKAKWRAW
jgi:hypothetical protein